MVLISLVPVLNLLYFYISSFRSRCAVSNMAVFYSSLTSCIPGMLLTCFLNEFETVPVAPIITGIIFVFTFLSCIYYYYYYYYKNNMNDNCVEQNIPKILRFLNIALCCTYVIRTNKMHTFYITYLLTYLLTYLPTYLLHGAESSLRS